jgi:hypothetical protein
MLLGQQNGNLRQTLLHIGNDGLLLVKNMGMLGVADWRFLLS